MKRIAKRYFKRITVASVCALALTLFVGVISFAQGEAKLMQTLNAGDNIDVYVSNLGEYTEATGQIGREAVDVVGFESGVSGHTIFLIDNSNSVAKGNLDKTKQIINDYLKAKGEKEKVSVAIFGENVEDYVVVAETDASKISAAIEGIENENKETYLTDALYDELQNYTNPSEYTRFVVVSDGVDNKAIGYTKEELMNYLKENLYPVYSIGVKNKNNEEMLKNMFAISRLTNAGYYLLDDYDTYEEIVAGLTEPISKVEIAVPDELRDGSTQNILLSFETSAGTVEIKDEVAMPFKVREKAEPTIEPDPEPTEEPVIEEADVELEDDIVEEPPVEEEKSSSLDLTQIIGIAVIVLALIGYLVYMLLKKKKSNPKPVAPIAPATDFGLSDNTPKINPQPVAPPMNIPVNNFEEPGTVFLGDNVDDEPKTVFLGGINNANAKLLVVTDKDDPAKVFRYPLRGRVIIGRKKDDAQNADVNVVINYDQSISGRHLAVSLQQDRLYIEDLNSSNGTFINGMPIHGVVPIANGSEVSIGRRTFILSVEE